MLKGLLNVLLSASSLLPILASAPLGAGVVALRYSFYMEPLSLTKKNSRIKFAFQATPTTAKQTAKLYIVNDLYPDGILIATASSATSAKNYSFDYDNAYTRSSNKIKLVTTAPKGSKTLTKEIETYVAKTSTITFSGQTITDESNSIILEANTLKPIKFTYKFNGFSPQYTPSYYQTFSPSDFSIESVSPFGFDNVNATLFITNRNGVYDDLPHDDEYAELPMKIVNKTLQFRDYYYVDPITLKMSQFKRSGYVETKHLYLPKNEMRYQGEYEGIMQFQDFGSAHAKVNFRFSLNALINIMGDCYNSEYCIMNNRSKS